MRELTPRQIVDELDRHIVGQRDAKRAVAVALRNRWRRQRLPAEMQADVTPKNIIMIGPTGVGKTEIARRLAHLVDAPFCKVEATKYTEVGYHGRDVESVVRDLVEVAFRLVREQERERVRPEAERRAERRLLDLLLAPSGTAEREDSLEDADDALAPARRDAQKHERVRQRLAKKLADGELDERTVSLRSEQKQLPIQVFSNMGMEQMDVDLQQIFERLVPKESKTRDVTVREARVALIDQEVEQLIDRESVGERAVRLAEDSGIIFIDEIDKIAGKDSGHGPDVSRQGVQRDLLPIVEGTTVRTPHGLVHTDHILFIAAGAFHVSKPADLMPELQGRFPIRVQLHDLEQQDLVRVLREPRHSLIAQTVALLATENLAVTFTDDALEALARFAHQANRTQQNIGARRLHTILERLLEDASFDAPEKSGESLRIDAAFVEQRLAPLINDEDLSRFIL